LVLPLSIYKPGQGYWTRVLSAVGAGVLVCVLAAWIWGELASLKDETWRLAIQVIAVIVIIGGSGAIGFWVMNKVRIVDFLIATDSEMRKVNWPARHEIIGSTIVVIGGTAFMAILLWVVNIGFGLLFTEIGILKVDY
jgi:preprotein translocase subunit SecE